MCKVNLNLFSKLWHGGRVLIWMPYKKIASTTTYNHVTDGSELVFDDKIHLGVYPRRDKEKKDRCLLFYSGPLAEKLSHANPKFCEEEPWSPPFEWSPCVICSIPHTLGKHL